jgi:hypothetical protein
MRLWVSSGTCGTVPVSLPAGTESVRIAWYCRVVADGDDQNGGCCLCRACCAGSDECEDGRPRHVVCCTSASQRRGQLRTSVAIFSCRFVKRCFRTSRHPWAVLQRVVVGHAHADSDGWYLFNDFRVTQTTLEDVVDTSPVSHATRDVAVCNGEWWAHVYAAARHAMITSRGHVVCCE